jgi:uncharacterized membrane-anchored protein YhcB (DUF1043 family)
MQTTRIKNSSKILTKVIDNLEKWRTQKKSPLSPITNDIRKQIVELFNNCSESEIPKLLKKLKLSYRQIKQYISDFNNIPLKNLQPKQNIEQISDQRQDCMVPVGKCKVKIREKI